MVEPETEYGFVNYVTINGIRFGVGEHVKRKKDKKIGVIENITKIDRITSFNEFRINFEEKFDYVETYTFYDIYKDEETELLDISKKYNIL